MTADTFLVSAAQTINVEMGDNFFRPDTITVAPGDTIVWRHTGTRPHDVTADNGAFSSPRRMSTGQTFSWTAGAAGTYTYLCTIHSAQQKGTIIVQAAAGTAGNVSLPRTGEGGMAEAATGQWGLIAGLFLAGTVLTLVSIRRRGPAV
jgi:plastocyanin